MFGSVSELADDEEYVSDDIPVEVELDGEEGVKRDDEEVVVLEFCVEGVKGT